MIPSAKCEFELTAILIEHAQSRFDSSAGVPTLCLKVQLENAMGTVCHVRQLFQIGQERQCESAAKKLRKGARVRLQAPSAGIELVMRNTTAVQAIEQPQQAELGEAVPA